MSLEDGARLLRKAQFDDIQLNVELPKDSSLPLAVNAKKSSKKGKKERAVDSGKGHCYPVLRIRQG
jgi:hypothetical protein